MNLNKIKEKILNEEYKNEKDFFWGGASLIIKNDTAKLKVSESHRNDSVIETSLYKELIWLIKQLFEEIKPDYIDKYALSALFELSLKKYVDEFDPKKYDFNVKKCLIYVVECFENEYEDFCDSFDEYDHTKVYSA